VPTTFAARLVTPEAVVFDEEVEAVILRTGVGDATFLAGHAQLVGSVEPGLVRFVRTEGSEQHVAAHGGFVHVEADGRVTVLPPMAELAEDIDLDRARNSLEAAATRLAELAAEGRTSEHAKDETTSVDIEVEEAEAARRRAEVRVEVAEGLS
jgi:F-type H+-transporting ATPase subunit epsilon